jgi:Concanavalin A-like lectin/glucanases superfamily
MQIYSLNTANCTPLSANYKLDETLQLHKNTLYTENNIFFNLERMFQNLNDTSINNYSSLYLTNQNTIDDFLNINPLKPLEDEGFSTTLAGNALEGMSDKTRYWIVQEPPFDINTANVRVSGIPADLDNRGYFEILLLDNFKCKIAHENGGVKRYLTFDSTGNFSFNFDAQLDYLGEYSPQIFLYIYDRQQDLMVFLKNVNDIINYVSFDPDGNDLILIPTIPGSDPIFNTQTVFRCQARQDTSNNTLLNDPWYSYVKNKNNNLTVATDSSFKSIGANMLLNSEYSNISGNTLDVNVLSLKNSNTPENYQSRSNPFFNESQVIMRDYKKLFTGSNQELGNDNITLGYDAFTSNTIFKTDKITYFHVPQNFYPLNTLNINDTKLAEAGAIAGDHPMKSDKIFKKKANYKFSSYFGDSRLENTGNFLCSWLSGNSNSFNRPVWVDRYYFPSEISFIGALTANNTTFNAVEYTSADECLKKHIPANIQVVDKISDSVFEPGTYFAYHHIGDDYSKNYINYLQNYLVQKDLNLFYNTSGALLVQQTEVPTYQFNGENYCVTDNLSALQDTNAFTIIFDMYMKDWTVPFGYQLLGNYTTDGFGVFNTNQVTPTLFLNGSKSITVTNLNFEKLNTVETTASVNAIIRTEGFNDFFVITSDGYLNKYNNRYSLIFRAYNPYFKNLYDYDYDENSAYILGKEETTNNARLYKVDLASCAITQVLSSSNYKFYYNLDLAVTPDIRYTRTVNFKDNTFYLTVGTKAERYLNSIYFSVSNTTTTGYSIYNWNIENINQLNINNDLVILAYTDFEDFDVDVDGNLWVLYDKYKFAKIYSNYQLALSGTLPLSTIKTTMVDFGYAIDNDGLKKYTFISALTSLRDTIPYVGGDPDQYKKLYFDFSVLSSYPGTGSQVFNLKNYPNYASIVSPGGPGGTFTGAYGGGMRFIPSALNNSSYIQYNNTSNPNPAIYDWNLGLNLYNKFTISFWIELKSYNPFNKFMIVGNYQGDGFRIIESNGVINFATGQQVSPGYLSSQSRLNVATGTIPLNTPTNIVYTVEPAGFSLCKVTCYVNGVQTSTGTGVFVTPGLSGGNIQPANIFDPNAGVTCIDGILYKAEIMNYSMPAQDVALQYNQRAAQFNVAPVAIDNSQYIRNITYKYDDDGNLIDTYYSKTPGSNTASITQSSFLRYYFSDLYTGNALNIRFKLRNYATNTTAGESVINSFYGLSALDPGYHNFALRFSSQYGTFHLIIDGTIVQESTFDPGKYVFSDLIQRPFFFGTAAYSNSIPIFSYLNDSSFNCRNIELKNVYLYDQALNYFDILMHSRAHQKVNDVIIDLPSGKRNYLEEIERFFKFRTPGHKSSTFNIKLKNSGIPDAALRNTIEQRIYNLLNEITPAYTKIQNIKWSES